MAMSMPSDPLVVHQRNIAGCVWCASRATHNRQVAKFAWRTVNRVGHKFLAWFLCQVQSIPHKNQAIGFRLSVLVLSQQKDGE